MIADYERLSIGLRVSRRDAGHTHFDVFAALAAYWLEPASVTRGRAGNLVLRTDEFDALVAALGAAGVGHVRVHQLADAPVWVPLPVPPPAAEPEAVADAARWLVASGYPIDWHVPDEAPPEPLRQAIIDHVWRDRSTDAPDQREWHDGLTRDQVDAWLTEEGGW